MKRLRRSFRCLSRGTEKNQGKFRHASTRSEIWNRALPHARHECLLPNRPRENNGDTVIWKLCIRYGRK